MEGEQPSRSEAELKVAELKIKLFDLLEEKDKAKRREDDLRAELAYKEAKNREEMESLKAKLEESDQRARMWEGVSTNLRKDLVEKEEEKQKGAREWTRTRRDFETANKALEEEIRVLGKKLEEKEEEFRTRSEEATEREETIKKDLSGAKDRLAFYLRSLEETTERWAKLKKERDELIGDRQHTAKILGELAQLIKMDFSEEDLKDLGSFLQRVVGQAKQVMESLGRQLAEGRGFLQSFGNLYQSACVSMGLDATSSVGVPSYQNADPNPNPDSEMLALDDHDPPPPQQPSCSSGQAASTSARPVVHRGSRRAPLIRKQPANGRSVSETRQRTNFVRPRGDHGQVNDPCGTGSAVPLFWCKCGLQFNDKDGLDMHVRKMTEEWRFHCRPCKWFFFHKSRLIRHQRTQCCIRKRMESGRLATLKRVRNVRASRIQQRPIRTRRPPQRFVNEAVPSQEETTDACSSSEEDEAGGAKDKLPFRCERCVERFERVCNLKRHLEKCHGETEPLKGLIGCGTCGGFFPGWEALRAHKRSAHRRSGTSDPVGDLSVELETPKESRVVADMSDLNAAEEPIGTRMEGVEESVLGAREGSENDNESPPNLVPEN